MSQTMKEVVVSEGPKVTINNSPFPTIPPHPDQVVIKVIVSGSNPKDWKTPNLMKKTLNQGDDIAGIVHAVGETITEFKVGDRVAAFHEMRTPGGSYAEYAVAWGYTTFHIPKKTSFEEAATIPLAAMTSALGLYQRLKLPVPWLPAKEPLPLVVYGAASAVGAFAIKLAVLSNIHPLICVAGRGIPFVDSLIDKSKGDTIIDYREGNEKVVEGIKKALGGKKLEYAFDAVSEKGSYVNICRVLEHGTGKITLVLPWAKYEEVPKGIMKLQTMVGSVHKGIETDSEDGKLGIKVGDKDFAFAFFRLFGRGLKEGWFKGHPYEVVPGGLGGVEGALENLMEGKASAVKYVFRIDDTEGVRRQQAAL